MTAERILVTGGAGFIGSHLSEALVGDGGHVTVLDDLSTGNLRNIQPLLPGQRFRFVLGSVMDPVRCDELVKECDAIIHLAAAVGVKKVFEQPLETIESNVRGTQNVLEAALKYGRKVFVASTSEVYGKATRDGASTFAESDDVTLGPSMRWCYACSKALDEYLARAYAGTKGLPVVIGRFFNTVGPRQSGAYGMVIPRFVEWALAGKPLHVYGDGSQVRSFTHVLDTVRAVRALMDEPAAEGEVINIGSQEPITILALARRIIEMTGSRSTVAHLPYEEAYGPGFEDIRNRVPNLGKISGLIRYRPEWTLDDILRDTIDHARKSGRS